MRAKMALALAALSAVTLLAPIYRASASPLTCEVARTLDLGSIHSRHLLKRLRKAAVVAPACGGLPAVVAGTASPNVIITDGNGTPMIRGLPAVIAPTSCGSAILTPAPQDLDERRDALDKRINEALAIGQLGPGQASDLKAAMGEIGQAEICWLKERGTLTNEMARRLYNSMDKVDRDLHGYVRCGSNSLVGTRILPNALYY